jgi:DNA-binding FrmR family transcriptional regulator
MHEDKKRKALIGLRKAASVIDRAIKLAEDGAYCVDIMQQNMAAIGLLKSAHQSLMENHLNHCFLDAMDSKGRQKKVAMVKEILNVSKLANR